MCEEEKYELQVKTSPTDQKISTAVNYSPEQVAVIKNTVAKNTTNLELAYFLSVCQSVDLNPFVKEIWCYKDKKGNMLVFAGRDGFLAKAQRNPNFNGMRSCEIRENDEFEIDVANSSIRHTVKGFGEERGAIRGAYAIVFRKDGEPTIELVDFARYNKGWSVWKTHPEEMIKKVAEVHALKKAFGISGIQCEYDFEVKDSIAKPLANPEEDLEYEISAHRKGEENITDEQFLKIVMEAEEIKKLTEGAKRHLRKVLFEEKLYDFATGDKSGS